MKRKYTLKITFLPKISKQVLIPGHNIWEEEGRGCWLTNNTTTVFHFQRPSRGCEIQVVKLSSSELTPNCVGSGGVCIYIAGNRDGLRQYTPIYMPILSCLAAGPRFLGVRALVHILFYLYTRSEKFTE